MGENEHQKHPLVAPPTQSVDSKPRIRLKSNSTSTCEKVKVKVIKSDTSIIKRLKKKLVKFQALADKIWIIETARDTSTDWTSLKERMVKFSC